jgi:drug/metabolite transporter (DMT)-like permease
MPKNRTTLPPVALVVIAVLLWSTGGLFIKLAVNLDAYQVTFFRSFLAGLTVLILTYKAGLRINAFGLMCSGIYATLLFLFVWATKHTTAANAIFLQYTAPVYILILAPFVIGEKFYKRDLATVIFCLLGMSLFFVGDLTIGDYQGNIAALGSGVFLGLYIMLLKHPRATGGSAALPTSAGDVTIADAAHSRVANKPLNPAITVIYGNFILALLTLPSGVAALPTATIRDYAAVTFLGVLQIGISYILFIKGVHGGTRPLDASIIGFIEPLLNPVWVFLFVGERPSNWAVLGGAIIICTIVAHTFIQYRFKPAVVLPEEQVGAG